MKKWIISVFALMLAVFGGTISLGGGVSFAENERQIIIDNATDYINTFTSNETYNDPNLTITLGNDLDFSQISMENMFKNAGVFKGTFDGNGYTISNITLSSNSLYYGLFPQAQNATIKNLRISGSVSFDIPENKINAIYAGVIVGYGENVVISNCELDYSSFTSGDNDTTANNDDIELSSQSNLTFGGIAGRLVSTTEQGQLSEPSQISNCVNYYNISANLNKDSRIVIGGVVGSISSGSTIKNCLQFGSITLSNLDQVSQSKTKYVGGITGEIDGSSTFITNTCNSGTITLQNAGTNAIAGTIVGYNNIANSQDYYNVNFSYWTQQNLNGIGGGYNIVSDKLARVSVINQNLLTNVDMFDSKEAPWDFATTWSMHESKLHIQNFMTFTYKFSAKKDAAGIISNGKFIYNSQTLDELSIKYGNDINIRIDFGEAYYGYYTLAAVLLNGDSLSSFTATPIQDERYGLTGYNISLSVNDSTDGTYSFLLVANQFNCLVEVSSEALSQGQGGVKTVDASTPTNSIPLVFTETNRSRQVTAVGNGVYSFSHWLMYYRDDNGDFTQEVSLDNDLRSALVQDITFGEVPFDKEFKLVAYFTDEKAILIDFDITGAEFVKSIKVSNVEYQGAGIPVPPNSTSTVIEITTNADCMMDVDSFAAYVQRVYGNNPTDTLLTDPVTNAENETTYTFRLNMNYVQGLTDNTLNLPLSFSEDQAVNKNLLWLYITAPIVGAIIIGVVIFFIVRKYRNGGGTGKGGKGQKVAKTKEKEVSYRDYYL